MTEDAWDSVLNTNLGGFYNVLRPLIMATVRARKGGRIEELWKQDEAVLPIEFAH